MSAAAQFRALSGVLTGEAELDATVSEGYRARIGRAYADDLAALLTAFEGIANHPDVAGELKAMLDQRPAFAKVAKELITVWYTSQFTKPDGSTDGPENVDQYRSALLWTVIKAHPPAVSSGPYGYWAHHPDQIASGH
jgi:hypothetical protein